jgi:phytoene dehydrogenase-like protein
MHGVTKVELLSLGFGRDSLAWDGAEGVAPTEFCGEDQSIPFFMYGSDTRKAMDGEWSEEMAKSFDQFSKFISDCSPFIRRLAAGKLPNTRNLNLSFIWSVATKAARLRFMGRDKMMELLRSLPMPQADLLGDHFGNLPEANILKGGLSAVSLGGHFLAPHSPGTAANLLLWLCRRQHDFGFSSAELVSALEKRFTDLGGKIVTNAELESIECSDQLATEVQTTAGSWKAEHFISTIDAKQTLLKGIGARNMDFVTAQESKNMRMRGCSAVIGMEFTEPLTPKFADQFIGKHIVFAPSQEYVERAFDAVKYGEFAESPVLELVLSDDKKSASLRVHSAPHQLDEKWSDQTRQKLLTAVSNVLSKFTSFEASHLASSIVMDPQTLEKRFGLSEGQIFHGEMGLDQMIARPIVQHTDQSSPLKNLYLGGAGCHPGGMFQLRAVKAAVRQVK